MNKKIVRNLFLLLFIPIIISLIISIINVNKNSNNSSTVFYDNQGNIINYNANNNEIVNNNETFVETFNRSQIIVVSSLFA